MALRQSVLNLKLQESVYIIVRNRNMNRKTQTRLSKNLQSKQLSRNWQDNGSHMLLPSSRMVFGEGNGTPLQYSCLENPMDGGAWWAAVHGVAKSQTLLSDFNFTFHFYALKKEMATHSSVLSWRIPGMGETGGLPSMGSHRVKHD